MALVHYYICDHCKKKLDGMHDYADSSIDICYSFVEADLCADCVKELAEIVRRYVGKERKCDE